MKKITSILLILCMSLTVFCGCYTMSEETSKISVSTEDLLKTAPLVFLGKVKEEGQGWYRNAEEVHHYDDGKAMFNYWITPYTVEILEVYKGEIKEDIAELTLGTYNERNPEEKKVEGDESFYLNVGDTAIFCVSYQEVDECYKPLYNYMGVFYPDKTPNIYSSGGNMIDTSDIDNLLKRAETVGIDRAAIAGAKVDIKAEHKKQVSVK